ncbi:MAG: hypothetical protein ACI35T_01775 [Alistipes sp.]
MYFTKQEKQSIVKVANMMINADGKTDITEVLLENSIFQRLKISQTDITSSDTMKPYDAINIITWMSVEQKRVVMAFLGCLMIIDGNTAESELALLSLKQYM